ncbi:MAG: hypothetical protein ACJAS6_001355 [Rickettsiales bacterium]|jgi:hypothetical protein
MSKLKIEHLEPIMDSVESQDVLDCVGNIDNARTDVATFFRTVFNKEKSKLCPISIETIIL